MGHARQAANVKWLGYALSNRVLRGLGNAAPKSFDQPEQTGTVGLKEVEEGIWLVSFMDYDLGYIDLEEKILQPLNNPFGPKV